MSEEFGKVTPDNRPRRQRRDPDADTPPPAAAVPPPVPEANRPTEPGPADPLPQPPGPAQPPTVPRATPPAVSTPGNGAGGGTLASVLTAPNRHSNGHSVSEGVAALAALAGMSTRPTDPMADWTGDGTRIPRFVAAAARQYATLTGRKTQEIYRNALLGLDPIPVDLLDANWLNLYGFPRDQYDPEAYR